MSASNQLPREQNFLLRLRASHWPSPWCFPEVFHDFFAGFFFGFPRVFLRFSRGCFRGFSRIFFLLLYHTNYHKKEEKIYITQPLQKSWNLFKFESVLLSASVERVGVCRILYYSHVFSGLWKIIRFSRALANQLKKLRDFLIKNKKINNNKKKLKKITQSIDFYLL